MAQIKVTQGTDFSINIICERYTDEQTTEAFDISVCQNVAINLLCEAHDEYISINDWELAEATTNVIQFTIRGDSLHAGAKYGLVITGRDGDGRKFKTRLRGKDFLYVVNSVSDLTSNEFITQPLNIILPMNFMGELQPIIFKDLATIAYVDEQIQDVEAYVDAAIAALPEVTIETDQTNGTKILHVGNKTMTMSTDRPSGSSQSFDAPTWAGMDAAITAAMPDLTLYETKADHNTDMTNVNNAIAEVGTQAGSQYAQLTQAINSEAQTRSTNDQALQTAITTVDNKLELYYPKTDVYNKTEIDGKVTTINTSIGGEESSRIAADDNLQTQINTKANTADVYNKTSVDYLLGNKADTSTTYTKTEVDGLLDDKADSDDVYDKTEVYTKTEVDELIEEGGGTTYTDTIIVGQGLITDDIKPTAKFGFFNNTTNSVFSVGRGSVASTFSASANFTPLNERGRTFTYVGNYDMESYIGANDQAFFINLTPNNTNKGYDDNDTEFTLNYNYYWPYIAPNFENHILKHTIKYRESAHPERNFDIDLTIEVDPSIPTTTFTLKTTRDIKLIQTPALYRGNVTRKDALSVDSDGYVNILSAPGGSGNTTYRLQDKFSNIETSINNINNTVSSLPTPEILSQTEYDNYLYHDPNKMYVTTEEDLTDYKNEYFTITPLSYGSPMGSFRLSINASNFSIEYSKDKITWTPYTSGSWYGFTDLEPVYLRGTGSAYSSQTKFGQFSFASIQNVKISGNIMSLLYGANFQNQTSLTEYNISFNQLFNGLSAITDASKLILPATSLTNLAYSQMFINCSNLTYGPKELPATTLTQYCYAAMFESCSKLAQPISLLPSTNGASNCYKGMYKNCISLAKSPSIRLTNGQTDFISLHLTDEMFYGCTSLKYVEIMTNHTSANYSLGSNFLYNVPNDPNSIFVMNGNSMYLGGIPNNWQVVKVTPPTN